MFLRGGGESALFQDKTCTFQSPLPAFSHFQLGRLLLQLGASPSEIDLPPKHANESEERKELRKLVRDWQKAKP